MIKPVRVSLRDFVPVMLFMTAIMLAFISQIQYLLVTGACLCALYSFSALSVQSLKRSECCLIVLSCTLFMPGFANPNHGLVPVFYFFSTVAAFFAAMTASRLHPLVLLKAFLWMYWASVATIAWALYTYWNHPEPFGMILEGVSTNGIPLYLILLQINLSLTAYLAHRRLPVVSTIFTFATAFFGIGRGSLVVAALIIAFTLIFNVFTSEREKQHGRKIPTLLIFLVVVIGVLRGEYLLELVTNHTKLSVGLVDANRLKILSQYIDKVDAFTLLFGADYTGTVIESLHNGNPHISYIRTHSFYGLPLTVLAILSPGLVLLAAKAFKPKLVFFVFISLAALRAITEPIFFPTLMDFFYFLWFLMYANHAMPTRVRPIISAHQRPCYYV